MNIAAFHRVRAGIFVRLQPLLLASFGRAPAGSALSRAIQAFSRWTVGPIPCVLKLDITNRCNIHCSMCYATHQPADASFEQITRILDQFRSIPLRLDLMGGEPLLHPELEKIIRCAKHIGIREVNIYTNATLMTDEKARALKEAGLDAAMVNLSSNSPIEHDRFTGVEGSWGKTTDGIRALRDAGVPTYAFIVLHEKNIGKYEPIRDFTRTQLKIKPVWYHYIPSAGERSLMADSSAWSAVKHRILYEDDPLHRKTITAINTFCGRICLGAYYSFSVKVNGDLTPCPFINDLVLGNLLSGNFWDFLSKRREHAGYRSFLAPPEECGGCAYISVCGGGCRAGNRDPEGNYSLRDCRCASRKETFSRKRMCDDLPTFF